MGEVRDGLYHYKPFSTSVFHSQNIPDSTIWHQRLGHPSNSCIPKTLCVSNQHLACDIYARAKHTRLPFSLNTNKNTFCFNRISCDIWGGYPTASHSGAHYFLTIVDDFSRTIWVYLMHMKSNTFTCLINFFVMVKTQFNCIICHMRINNDQEFMSNKLQTFFHDHGILHERTCVDTPQQNGVAERKHRHLLNVARCLRFQANLPISILGECILTTTYLINRTPSPSLKHKSSYELLFKKPPSYIHSREFGRVWLLMLCPNSSSTSR